MMSVTEDKVFEDQIERMKLKNQKILERFQSCEEDRKLAESSGSTINKTQNVQIRLRNDDQTRTRKKSNPPQQRPKSHHDNCHDDGGHGAYSQFNEYHKQGKFHRNNNVIDDEVAYQDYFHFQQTHRNKFDQNYQNRYGYQENNSHSYPDDNYRYKAINRDYQQSTSQKHKGPARYSDTYNFHTGKATRVSESSVYKLDNTNTAVKDPIPRAYNANSKTKPKHNNHSNNQNVDPVQEKKPEVVLQNVLLDDEYIDDTLEDLEKYRLKVDMDDFTVIDPESPNPILAMPLSSWAKDVITTDSDSLNMHESSSEFLHNANERAKNYLNLVGQVNLGTSSCEKEDKRKFDSNNINEERTINKVEQGAIDEKPIITKEEHLVNKEYISSKEEYSSIKENNLSTNEQNPNTKEEHLNTKEEHLVNNEYISFKEEYSSIKENNLSTKEQKHCTKEEHFRTKEEHLNTKEEHPNTKEEPLSIKEEHPNTKEEHLIPKEEHPNNKEEHPNTAENHARAKEDVSSDKRNHISSDRHLNNSKTGDKQMSNFIPDQ